MYFIRITNYRNADYQYYINPLQIESLKITPDFTLVTMLNDKKYDAKESPEEIFQIMKECLGDSTPLHVHHGVLSNQPHTINQ